MTSQAAILTDRAKSSTPEYQLVNGIRIGRYTYDPNIFLESLKYIPRDDDTFIVTYPKCGTTWVQQIVWLIFNNATQASDGEDFFTNSPFLEKSGLDCVNIMKRPNAIKSHLPYHFIPRSTTAKYIYVTRNYKDCCVSFYHHTLSSAAYNFNGSLDTYFELFYKGEVDFGDYFDHLRSWYPRRNDPNVLFLIYEKMIEDPIAAIKSIASFLGSQYSDKLEKDPDFLRDILRFSQLDFMKKSFNDFFLEQYHYDLKLIRVGGIGNWRKELKPEYGYRLDKKADMLLEGTELLRYWRENRCIKD